MSEILDLGDLCPQQLDVTFKGRDGKPQRYVVREASAAAGVAYRNATSRASKYVEGKFVGTDGLADAEPLLVGMCVFQVDDRGGASRNPVGTDEVLSWPDRVQDALFDMIKDLSTTLQPETLESIDRQLDRLQKRRAMVVREMAEKNSPNVQAPTTPGT